MYTFTPMTEEQINDSSLIEEGVYDFEVVKSTRKMSNAQNPMAELQLNIWDKEGKQHLVYDYLVFSSVPLNIKKVKHFCEAVGLADQYNVGQIPEELERYCGKVHVIKQAGKEIPFDKLKGKPAGSCYPDKNAVEDYIKSDQQPAKKEAPKDDTSFDDDSIPF